MKPFLCGKAIRLRLLERSDAAEYLDLANDVASMGPHWLLSEVRSLETLTARLGVDGCFGDTSGRVLITDEAGRMVGTLVYFKPVTYWEALEIGYRVFSPQDQNKGYATEAVKLMSSFLFESRRIARLQVVTDPENRSANAVAKAAGYQLEGRVRQAVFCRGKMKDQNMWSQLPEEALPLSSQLTTPT